MNTKIGQARTRQVQVCFPSPLCLEELPIISNDIKYISYPAIAFDLYLPVWTDFSVTPEKWLIKYMLNTIHTQALILTLYK